MFRKFYNELTRSEQDTLLKIARNSITAKLTGKKLAKLDCDSKRLKEARGAFVTLKKDNQLRGCIGLITAIKPLYQTVQDAAQASAFEDPRFSPLKKHELKDTRIEISIIGPLKKINSIKKIKVRRDGVLIRRGEHQGLLLPQVAKKNRWNRETLLKHVCLKADLKEDDWKKPETEIMAFTAQVFEETTNEV